MTKPRDMAGNDFIAPCTWLAGILFLDKYKRMSNLKCNKDSKKMRELTNDLYAVVMRHWRSWDE